MRDSSAEDARTWPGLYLSSNATRLPARLSQYATALPITPAPTITVSYMVGAGQPSVAQGSITSTPQSWKALMPRVAITGSLEMGRIAHRLAGRQFELDATKRRESCANGSGEVRAR